MTDHLGLVEEADKGVLFLDEINSMPPAAQVKLNRFLMTGEFRHLGENKLRKVDVRIIAATNQSLKAEIENGNFREDLYYRLAEYIIELPPLRMRVDDIQLLMDYFLKSYGQCYKKTKLRFTEGAYEKAKKYFWPGNIRQLENVIKRCVIDTKGEVIAENDFKLPAEKKSSPLKTKYFHLPMHQAKEKVVKEFEKNYLTNLLFKNNGNVEECARQSNKHRSAFWALLKKHNIDPQKYRG